MTMTNITVCDDNKLRIRIPATGDPNEMPIVFVINASGELLAAIPREKEVEVARDIATLVLQQERIVRIR